MDKNEILEKSRTEKNNEFEKKALASGYAYGMCAIIIVCSLLILINIIFLKRTNMFDYTAIMAIFVSISLFYRFKKTKKKSFLITSIVFAVLFIIAMIFYILMALAQ